MANLIFGRELSCYVTVGIALGQSKKQNRQGVQSKYVVFFLKDKDAKGSDTVKKIYFEEDVPGLIEALIPFRYINQTDCPDEIKNNPKHTLYNAINVQLAKSSAEATNPDGILNGYFEWWGGQTETYHFRKGMCYANDADGNRSQDGTGHPIMRDSIQVFTQVKYLMPNNNGGYDTKYVGGLDLESQGQQLENRFWREAVGVPVTPDVMVPGASSPDANDPFA